MLENIGRKLKEAREGKGLTLEDVYKETKISKTHLEAIEEGNLSALPEIVYVRGFLKSYAKFLDLDPEEILAEFDSIYREIKEVSKIPIKRKESKKLKIPLISIFICLIIYFLLNLFFKEKPKSQISKIPKVKKTFSKPKEIKSFKLTLKAKEDVWISVKPDKEKEYQELLHKGDVRTFFAKDTFLLTIGNIGGIEVYVNDIKVKLPEVKGRVLKNLLLKRGEK